MRVKIIGIGAAGNKAAIAAAEDSIVKLEDVLLINSTLKDIPADYSGEKYCFENAYGGCGKERNIARNLTMENLQSGSLNIKKFLRVGEEDQTELAIIVSSTEGGTGSGTAPVLAKYINDVCGINVHCFGFTGFEEDGRGLRNTVEYFKEMEETFTVECLQNSKFLDECNGNKLKAEKAANASFCKKISILIGNPLRDSSHNIDQTDLLKIATTPGYMIIEQAQFKKIKNKQEFRALVESMIDNSKTLDLNSPSQRKMAVIININADNTDIIDYQNVLTNKFGMCFEKFEHIQHEANMPEFIAFISAGSNIPVDEIQDIFDKYKEYTGQVNKSHDDFFAKAQDLEFDQQDDMFDMQKKDTVNDNDFFKSMGMSNQQKFTKTQTKLKTVKEPVREDDIKDEY